MFVYMHKKIQYQMVYKAEKIQEVFVTYQLGSKVKKIFSQFFFFFHLYMYKYLIEQVTKPEY